MSVSEWVSVREDERVSMPRESGRASERVGEREMERKRERERGRGRET